jgi:membrane protein implicated in regulation of membrane protease activity
MMALSAVWIALSPMPLWAQIAVVGLMLAVALWLWRRPEA